MIEEFIQKTDDVNRIYKNKGKIVISNQLR
jgi:hypothetical protein